jgi:hypothetical protein
MAIRGHLGTHVIDGILLNGIDSRIQFAFSLDLIQVDIHQLVNRRWKKTYQCGIEPKLGQHIGHTVGQIVKIIDFSNRFLSRQKKVKP